MVFQQLQSVCLMVLALPGKPNLTLPAIMYYYYYKAATHILRDTLGRRGNFIIYVDKKMNCELNYWLFYLKYVPISLIGSSKKCLADTVYSWKKLSIFFDSFQFIFIWIEHLSC